MARTDLERFRLGERWLRRRPDGDRSHVKTPTFRGTDIKTDSLELRLEAKMSQRLVLKRELEAIETGLAEANGRYNEAKSAMGVSPERLKTEMQTKRSEVARVRNRIGALDAEIGTLAERDTWSPS